MSTIALHPAPARFSVPSRPTPRPVPPRPAPGRARLRLTARGRSVFGTLAVAPVLVVALMLGWGAPGAVAEQSASLDTFSYVSVAPGQSLWQVAEALAPSADPREVVAQIMSLNQLESPSVTPGQRLAIPTAYAP